MTKMTKEILLVAGGVAFDQHVRRGSNRFRRDPHSGAGHQFRADFRRHRQCHERS